MRGDGGQGGGLATGQLINYQGSDAASEATLAFGPDALPSTPTQTTASVYVNVGWVSNGLALPFPLGNWERGANVNMNWRAATLIISGGPTGSLQAFGFDSGGFYFTQSTNPLDAIVGTLVIGPGDFADRIDVGDVGRITTFNGLGGAGNGVFSRINVMANASGGGGAGGGGGGTPAAAGGLPGIPGQDGTNCGLGAAGGKSGAGGTRVNGGGIGGDGGQGCYTKAFEGNIFQGVFEIIVED